MNTEMWAGVAVVAGYVMLKALGDSKARDEERRQANDPVFQAKLKERQEERARAESMDRMRADEAKRLF